MGLFMLVILCVTFSFYGVDAGRSISEREGLKLEAQHMILDEPIANTIQSSAVGDFDCVDIYKQPAFDHPLLKNHKIQMNPSFSTRSTNEVLSNHKVAKLDLHGEGCPQGMVPIQRTKVQDQTYFKSFSKSHGGSFHTLAANYPGEHSATLDTTDGGPYHGAKATISIHNPHVEMEQYSKANIWVRNGPDAETNSIEVGWAVHPALYGDNRTRFTAYWTADGYQNSGCYNQLCPGFVQVDQRHGLGGGFANISTYKGVQFIAKVRIVQDQGNWWIFVDDIKVGYWPKEIFTHLASGASSVRYGGVTYSPPNLSTPVPMGNGLIPDRFLNEAGFFTEIQIVNAENQMVDIDSSKMGKYIDDYNQCYNLQYFKNQGPGVGHVFTFGGPGGKCQFRLTSIIRK